MFSKFSKLVRVLPESPEHNRYKTSGRCRNCFHHFVLSIMRGHEAPRLDTLVTCPACCCETLGQERPRRRPGGRLGR